MRDAFDDMFDDFDEFIVETESNSKPYRVTGRISKLSTGFNHVFTKTVWADTEVDAKDEALGTELEALGFSTKWTAGIEVGDFTVVCLEGGTN